MTNAQLIAILQKYPADIKVVHWADTKIKNVSINDIETNIVYDRMIGNAEDGVFSESDIGEKVLFIA